jgi:hypothetical protein
VGRDQSAGIGERVCGVPTRCLGGAPVSQLRVEEAWACGLAGRGALRVAALRPGDDKQAAKALVAQEGIVLKPGR